MTNIIKRAEANQIIESVLDTFNVKSRKNTYSYGLIESVPDEFAYLYVYARADMKTCRELNKGVFTLEFHCGVRQMKEFTPDEMREKAQELYDVSEATRRLTEAFADVLVELED